MVPFCVLTSLQVILEPLYCGGGFGVEAHGVAEDAGKLGRPLPPEHSAWNDKPFKLRYALKSPEKEAARRQMLSALHHHSASVYRKRYGGAVRHVGSLFGAHVNSHLAPRPISKREPKRGNQYLVDLFHAAGHRKNAKDRRSNLL